MFARTLGIGQHDASSFRMKLLEIAATGEAVVGELDIYGQRYTIDFEMVTVAGTAVVGSGWIILRSEQIPRFLTCYVRKEKS